MRKISIVAGVAAALAAAAVSTGSAQAAPDQKITKTFYGGASGGVVDNQSLIAANGFLDGAEAAAQKQVAEQIADTKKDLAERRKVKRVLVDCDNPIEKFVGQPSSYIVTVDQTCTFTLDR